MRKAPLDYSFEIACSRHEDAEGTTCFSAQATIRDASGNEVSRAPTSQLHAYVEAAEDEAVQAARAEIRRLRKAKGKG
ncbi:MAG TPA: hypothetical protein VN813_09535 [Luteibacter sp.]|nr:hypothetical protein [Luteibacter sp.]